MEVLSRTTFQNLTYEKSRYPNVQERICEYQGYLNASLESEDFGTSLDDYDPFINDDE